METNNSTKKNEQLAVTPVSGSVLSEPMTIEKLENRIGFQIGFLLHSGKSIESTIENLKNIAIEYAKQPKDIQIANLYKCIEQQKGSIEMLHGLTEPLKNRVRVLESMNSKYREKLGISNEPIDPTGLVSPLNED